MRLIAAIADDQCRDVLAPRLEKEYFKDELRTALGESAVSVNNRILLARELTGRLSATLTTLESGMITVRHARHLVESVIGLEDPDAGDVEAAVLPFASNRDLSAFARKVRREVLKHDARSPEDQVVAVLEDRRVWASPVYPCLTQFGALLPADGAQLLMTALDVLADEAGPGDLRTMDQRRADALVQLAADALDGYSQCSTCAVRNDTGERSTEPRWQGARPTIQVTVALFTLLGLDSQPGELEGYGPIPADLALRIASEANSTWRRLVTDELGQLVDYGRTTYRPPADLRDFIIARDRTCMFPTCNLPRRLRLHRRGDPHRACRCEIDHITRWSDGGDTNAENLTSCRCTPFEVQQRRLDGLG